MKNKSKEPEVYNNEKESSFNKLNLYILEYNFESNKYSNSIFFFRFSIFIINNLLSDDIKTQ